ncbi:unnamed protein product [Peniophora sp. CBMAI 1063]|nr:unnamed protein product [Peniophora sp. CBMAI 1063]
MGDVSPISELVGLPIRLIPQPESILPTPLVVQAEMAMGWVSKEPFTADLMISPTMKKSPRFWQLPRTVVIKREGRKKLKTYIVELLAVYCLHLRTVGTDTVPSPEHFREFFEYYRRDVIKVIGGARAQQWKHVKWPL